jgi:hypothetical protein
MSDKLDENNNEHDRLPDQVIATSEELRILLLVEAISMELDGLVKRVRARCNSDQ